MTKLLRLVALAVAGFLVMTFSPLLGASAQNQQAQQQDMQVSDLTDEQLCELLLMGPDQFLQQQGRQGNQPETNQDTDDLGVTDTTDTTATTDTTDDDFGFGDEDGDQAQNQNAQNQRQRIRMGAGFFDQNVDVQNLSNRDCRILRAAAEVLAHENLGQSEQNLFVDAIRVLRRSLTAQQNAGANQ